MLGIIMAATIAAIMAPVFGYPLWIAFSPAVVFGIACVAAMVRQLFFAISGRSWPRTEGRVISARIRRRLTIAGSQASSNEYWEPVVKYEYTVAGNRYVGSGAGLCDPATNSPSDAAASAKRYQVGSKIEVFYRPGKPRDSLLIPGQIGRALVGLAAVTFLTLGFVSAMVLVAVFDR